MPIVAAEASGTNTAAFGTVNNSPQPMSPVNYHDYVSRDDFNDL
jgi:hypothetical protein